MERKAASRVWLAGLAAVVVCFGLTLLYLRPVWAVWQDHIAPVPEDPVFNLYVLKWSVHQIRLGLPDLWNANVFYPTRGALALSDHLLGPAFQLALFELVIPNAVAGYNALFVTSFVASALATAWVLRRGGRSAWAALLAGWMFAFAPFRLQHFNHIQMLIAQWIPLTLWWWDRLLAERTPGSAVRFLGFYLLHVTAGCYLAYMIHVPMLVLFLNRLAAHGRGLLDRRALRVVAPALAAGLAVTASLFLPYLEVSRRLGLSRNDDEIRVMGATLASYVSPSTENLYFDTPRRGFFRTPAGIRAAPFYRTENALFAGFLPTIFALVGLGAWLRGPHPRGEEGNWERGLALSGLVCCALTFPIVYLPLTRIVPGLNGMRVPVRFYAFVSLAVVWFAARGVDLLLDRFRSARVRAGVGCALAVLLAVELAPKPVHWVPLLREEHFPAVYQWMARRNDVRAVLELPIRKNWRENVPMYYSTLGWWPVANGYSGYEPWSHREIAWRIHSVPDRAAVDFLRRLGISHILIHEREVRREGPDARRLLDAFDADLASGPDREIEPVWRDETIRVYRILRVPAAPGLG